MVAREHAVGVQRLDGAEESGTRMSVLARVVAEFTRFDERGRAGVARRQPDRVVLLVILLMQAHYVASRILAYRTRHP